MSEPAVSVIIPTYNRVNFLREALDSVHKQTFTDYEVTVVDDGSTDDIAASIGNHPVGPRIVRQQQQGPASARNAGIREARAKILAFLDSDDLWHPEKLESFFRKVESNPDIRIFYGPMSPIDERGNPVSGRTKRCYDGWITQALFLSSFVHVPSVVCHKAALDEAALDEAGCFNNELPVCEDYDLWLRLSVNERFCLVERPLAFRRLHRDRLSKRMMSRNLAVKAKVLREFYDSNLANGHLDHDKARARLARVHFVAGREALRGGDYLEAVNHCQSSREFGCPSVRAVPLMLRARLMARLRHGQSEAAMP